VASGREMLEIVQEGNISRGGEADIFFSDGITADSKVTCRKPLPEG
jgi:hypothetical protein